MSNIIGDLAVRISGDSTGLVKAGKIAKAQMNQLRDEAKELTVSFGKMGAASATAGAAIAAGLAVKAAETAKELKNLSDLANAQEGTFTKWAHGAKSVGIEQDKLSDILKDMNDRVGDFLTTGGGPMADFFENVAPKIDVTIDQFKHLSGPEVLQLYVSSLERANLSQQEMTFYMEAMASDSTALIPLLKSNGEGMAEFANEAERLGLVLSETQLDALGVMSEDLDRATAQAKAFSDQFGAHMAPAITNVLKLTGELTEEMGGVGAIAMDASNAIIDGAGFVADSIDGVVRVVEVAGSAIALFGLGAKETFLSISDFILNRPIDAINEFIDALNTLPWHDIENIDLGDLGGQVRDEMNLTRLAVEQGYADIENILGRPLPSESFERFKLDATEQLDSIDLPASKFGDFKTELVDNLSNIPLDVESLSVYRQEAEMLLAALDKPLTGENLEQFESRAESMFEALGANVDLSSFDDYKTRVTDLLQAMSAPLDESNLETYRENVGEHLAALEEQHTAHKERMVLIDQDTDNYLNELLADSHESRIAAERWFAEESEAINEQRNRAVYSETGTALSNLATLQDTESRKMFEIGKAAAISDTVINTYSSAQKSYDALAGIPIVGPGLGIAAASAAALAGFARVQAIGARSLNKSVGGNDPGSSASSAATTGLAAPQQQPVAAASPVHYVDGIDPSKLYSGEALVEIFNNAQRAGARLESV